MGRKTNYFRHSLDAHRDTKIIDLMAREGLRGVGAYFILLEIYGRALMNDDEQRIEQKISLKHYSNAIGSRSDHARNLIVTQSELGLIVVLWSTYDDHNFMLSIPNFMKYFGLYKKTEPMNFPTKRKEKKRKVNNIMSDRDQSLGLTHQENKLATQSDDQVGIIVNYLNEKLGAKFNANSGASKKLINTRLSEGFSVDDFKRVIDAKYSEWIGTEWQKYLRPITLFGTKFESYLNQPQSKNFEQFLKENAPPEA
jgi:uncharacterized phage protein (TIGR02220 family)